MAGKKKKNQSHYELNATHFSSTRSISKTITWQITIWRVWKTETLVKCIRDCKFSTVIAICNVCQNWEEMSFDQPTPITK